MWAWKFNEIQCDGNLKRFVKAKWFLLILRQADTHWLPTWLSIPKYLAVLGKFLLFNLDVGFCHDDDVMLSVKLRIYSACYSYSCRQYSHNHVIDVTTDKLLPQIRQIATIPSSHSKRLSSRSPLQQQTKHQTQEQYNEPPRKHTKPFASNVFFVQLQRVNIGKCFNERLNKI